MNVVHRFVPRPIVFCTILICSMGLRLVNLGAHGLFLDEAWSWAVSRLSALNIIRLSLVDPHPPLYYALLKLWLLVSPDTEYNLRLLSVFLSTASLAVILAYVGRRWSAGAMFFVGLLIAGSSFDIYYSQDTRMYALLSFLWVCSYLALAVVFEGRRKAYAAWTISTVLMTWTHFYGVIAAGTHVAFALAYLLLKRRKTNQKTVIDHRLLIVGAVCITVGAMFPLLSLMFHSSHGATGAKVPSSHDLSVLYVLWTTGLTSARAFFLDNSNLVLPEIAGVSMNQWLLVGTAIVGAPAVWGLYMTWRSSSHHQRLHVLLAIALILLPVSVIFFSGVILSSRVWALKSFLGSAYIVYFWAGIGISKIKLPPLRILLGVSYACVTLLSLWPYYGAWQKDPSSVAFRKLPASGGQAAVFLTSVPLSPMAFYYLRDQLPMYSLAADAQQTGKLIRIVMTDEDVLGEQQVTGCEQLASVTDILVYQYNERVQRAMKKWPECVVTKALWSFQQGRWQRITR